MDQPGVDIYEVPLSPIKPKKIRARKSTPKPPMRPAPAVVVEDEHDLETMFSALKSSTRDTASRGFKASRKSISVEEPLSSQSANQLSEQPRKFIMAKPLRTAREPKIGFKLPRINKQLTVDPVEADVEEADKRATHQYEVYTPEGHSILSDTSDLIKSQLNISHGRNKVLADEADVVQISKDSEFRIQGKKATKTDSIQKTAKRRGQTANNIDEPRKVRRTTTGKMSSEKTYDVEYIFDHYVDKKVCHHMPSISSSSHIARLMSSCVLSGKVMTLHRIRPGKKRAHYSTLPISPCIYHRDAS